MIDDDDMEGVECINLRCTELVSPQRAELGYEYCLKCGEAEAKVESKRKASMVQIPYSKGAYQYIHNPADLIGTNPKRTL